MKSLKALFVLALAVAFTVPAYAETQNVKVSGSIDAYWFVRDNFDLRKKNDMSVVPTSTVSYTGGGATLTNNRENVADYFMGITQIEVAADLTDNVSTVINLVNQRDWNAHGFGESTLSSSPLNTPNEYDITLDLAYVQMKEIFYSPLTLTIGRQDLLFGRGFIIGWNPQDTQSTIAADEYTAVQSFDAVRATLDFNPWTIDLVYSKIAENALNAEDDKDLYIANVNYKFAEYNAVAEGYYVGEMDRATLSTHTTASVGSNDTHIIGGRVQFDPISQITLGGEVAYAFGNYRAVATAPDRDRSAWALDLFGEYRWDYTWKPMLGLEYVVLSGESDLSNTTAEYGAWNDNYRGPTYGRIHEYLETYYGTAQSNDQPSSQNLELINLYGTLKPLEDLQLSANFYYFWGNEDMHSTLTNPASSTLSKDIGYEIDTMITYSYTEDVSFNFIADWFVPGDLYSSPNDATAGEYITSVKVTF